jgi:hypothetical protein
VWEVGGVVELVVSTCKSMLVVGDCDISSSLAHLLTVVQSSNCFITLKDPLSRAISNAVRPDYDES